MVQLTVSHNTIPVVVFGFIAGVALMRVLSATRHFFQTRKRIRRFKRGAEGEKEALSYLRGHGFTISNIQGETGATVMINGVSHDYTVRADYLAVKKGKRCIVEVKTGKKAVDPLFSDTRRQLLEYAVTYNADKIYLFNADDNSLMDVSFPMLKKSHHYGRWWVGFIVGLASGAVAMMIWLR